MQCASIHPGTPRPDPPPAPERRGVALLIVLAVLVLTVTASAGLARLASTTVLRRAVDQQTHATDDLRRAADSAIMHWLDTNSKTVVLPADATVPAIEILNDQWTAGGATYRLRITAWDQCGMTPIGVLNSASPLRMAIPADVAVAVGSVQIASNQKPGLDSFTNDAPSAVRVFPQLPPAEPLAFGGEVVQDPSEPIDQASAIGAYIATHNRVPGVPGAPGVPGVPGVININTAPIDLVEAALRLAGRGGLEQVIASRTAGEPTSLASLPSGSGDRRSAPQIVGASNAWACRIDINVRTTRGSVERSWWAVYVKDTSKWRCAQRLAITE